LPLAPLHCRIALLCNLPMTKKDVGIGKPKRLGRPPKGKLKVTLRLSPRVVDALAKAREKTGRDKSDLTEQALVDYLGLGTGKPQEPPR
jgi:hypothetical protein